MWGGCNGSRDKICRKGIDMCKDEYDGRRKRAMWCEKIEGCKNWKRE